MFLLSKKLLVLIVTVALLFGNERRQYAEGLKCWVCESGIGTDVVADHQCGTGGKEYSMEVDATDEYPACFLIEARNKTTNDVEWISRSFDRGTRNGKAGTCDQLANIRNWNATQCFCNQDDCNKGAINGVGGREGDDGGGGTVTGSFEGNGIAVSVSLVLLVGTKYMI
ncbi:hypothetical protein Ocin01_15907 [Orchesella cincta]|uniref:Protein sleepless n=1 Tax=Orchesella cincta TaxID=48709 RepID=A0A1D2MCY6_ORCCI|nr:hypothetical protein Ocin01_15907 [Orchesella cincta]